MPVQAVMTEARRREYLAALGLPLFVARAPLPGAAVSLVEAELEPPVAQPVAARPAPAPDAMPGAVPVAAPVQSQASQPRLAEAASQTVARADQPSFSCRLLRVSPRQVVLLDLGAYPDLGSPERQLWQSLCRAFDWQPRQLADDFSWPLASASRAAMIGSGSEAARAFLQGWLGRDLNADDCLLVLGPALAELVERPHRMLPSLAELLASPLAKRALWRQLASDSAG